MLAGEIYDAGHIEFQRRLQRTRALLYQFNNLSPEKEKECNDILQQLFGRVGDDFHINQPLRCDYGCNIYIGDNFFANFNLTILDEAAVTIGNNVFIGPNVSIYTACHPLDPTLRNTCVEWAEPVTIGNSVWIGGDAVILPGVSIGDGSVIGAGAVVTKDVPGLEVWVGNPAHFIRKIKVNDK